jgi:hypothetical protein
MQELKVNQMENVYGIKKMVVNVDNSNKLFQDIIYSRNGIFKTSFSTCLYELSNGNEQNIKDRITDTSASIKLEIVNDGVPINDLKNKFIVFSREIYQKHYKKLSDYDKELELLTIKQEDKEYIERLIVDDTEEPLIELKVKSKGIGLDFEKTMDLLGDKNLGYLDNIIYVLKSIEKAPNIDITQVNFKKIFQKSYDFIDNVNFKDQVHNYIEIVNKRIKEELFDDKFDENNCLSFLDTIKKEGFLSRDKNRGLIIQNKEYYDFEDIEKLFKKTIKKIAEDPKVLEINKELLKTIGNSAEANNIKKEIINNPILVKELSLGKKDIIKIALKNSGVQTEYWIEILENTKKELSRVLNQVKNKKNYFEEAIEIYKNRFHPIFDIDLFNRQESMLGLEMPYIVFKHKSNPNYELDEDKLYDILSSGEKTTLNIIKFIVEYISNKENNPIIILDDIVETFDYSNRYAFIEYINDMVKDGVTLIVLTHNFEFYRTLSSRVSELRKLVASVDKKGVVYIQKNKNISRNIENILDINNEETLYFAIPYLREAKTILQEDTSLLTSCLHYKARTKNIRIKDILVFFPRKNLTIDGEKLYLDGLKELADKMNEFDEYDLSKKTILSICCRVFLEEKIIANNISIAEETNCNQFAYLKEMYKDELNENVVQLMEKIQLATPEFIHGNAFMYEPLVDIDGKYLKEIYEEVIKLDSSKIWKKKKANKEEIEKEELVTNK